MGTHPIFESDFDCLTVFGWSDNGPEKSLEREILKRPLKIMPDSGQSAAGNSVTVAVRVRPMNKREIGLGTKCCIEMDGNQTILQSPNNTVHKQNKVFAFDYSFWSMDPSNSKFADQETVFNGVGKQVLDNAIEGFNACIFAYGQTGSGKSYSMMGVPGQANHDGLIPRITKELYNNIDQNPNPDVKYKGTAI